MTGPRWLIEVEHRVTRWLAGNDTTAAWVVAVSGGSDSVALLRVLHALAPRLNLHLVVAHLDHGARGEASRADAAFVSGLAHQLGLPCEVGHWSPPRVAHFEADARRTRHAFLLAVAQTHGASAVALGHTRDDQAETVLHRIVRGAGLRGLAGIPARRRLGPGVDLVRPLLHVSRGDLQAYLEDLDQPFREDATNADPGQTRARIRHDLLPRLAAALNPEVAEALSRLARQSRAAGAALGPRVRRLLRQARLEMSQERVVLDRVMLAAAPGFLRREALRMAWRQAGWPESGMTERRWRRLDGLTRGVEPAPPIDIGHGVRARVESSRLILVRSVVIADANGPAHLLPEPTALPVPGVADWPGGRVIAGLDPAETHDEQIDLDRVELPLFVRAPRPGDRVALLGLGGHTQPLKELLRRARLVPDERRRLPLVCDQAGIVWVVGHRIADRVKRTETTANVLTLRWESMSGPEPPGPPQEMGS